MDIKKWIKTSKNLEFIKNMPPVYHKLPGKEYSRDKSEVLNWILNSPEIYMVLEYVFSVVNGRDKRREQFAVYNPETGKWQGVDYNSKKETELCK